MQTFHGSSWFPLTWLSLALDMEIAGVSIACLVVLAFLSQMAVLDEAIALARAGGDVRFAARLTAHRRRMTRPSSSQLEATEVPSVRSAD